MAAPRLTHHGKSPVALCFSTLGGDGAVDSFSTVQRLVPCPVTPETQPEGTVATVSESKLIISDMTTPLIGGSRASTMRDALSLRCLGPTEGALTRHP